MVAWPSEDIVLDTSPCRTLRTSISGTWTNVAIAQQNKVVAGRKMRIGTTVVETNIHYPTDSSLPGDGVRVLTRL